MRSLKSAIVRRIIAALCVVNVVAAVAAYNVAHFEAGQFMDDYMRQFASVTELQAILNLQADSFQEPEDRFERLVWKSGALVASSAGAPHGVREPNEDGFSDLHAGADDWRVFVVRSPGRTSMYLQKVEAREELALHAAAEVSAAILAALLVAYVIIAWTVERTMRRLNALAGQIAERSVDAKDRLPLAGVPSEIVPIVDAMNALTDRLRAALDQQKRFVADSAHELRTPLTALRIQIDGLARASVTEAAEATVALRAGIIRAGNVLNQLLRLARFDSREAPDEREIVAIDDVVAQCVADTIEIAEAAGIDLGFKRVDRVKARMARADAQLLVSNILDNAVRYTPRGGEVDCELLKSETGMTFRVSDTGPGVAVADLPRLTQRFFRSQPRNEEGSGLGLSIVKAIADAYGLGLSISNRADRSGLVVTVTFPGSLLIETDMQPLDEAAAKPTLTDRTNVRTDR